MAVSTLGLGKDAVLNIDTANVGDFLANSDLGGWSTFNLTFRTTNPDSTNVDTAGWEGKEYGIQGVSLSADILDDQANDTVTDTLIADMIARTKRYIRVKPRVGTGYLQWTFKIVLNNAAWTVEQGGIVRFTLAGDSDGSVAVADQT